MTITKLESPVRGDSPTHSIDSPVSTDHPTAQTFVYTNNNTADPATTTTTSNTTTNNTTTEAPISDTTSEPASIPATAEQTVATVDISTPDEVPDLSFEEQVHESIEVITIPLSALTPREEFTQAPTQSSIPETSLRPREEEFTQAPTQSSIPETSLRSRVEGFTHVPSQSSIPEAASAKEEKDCKDLTPTPETASFNRTTHQDITTDAHINSTTSGPVQVSPASLASDRVVRPCNSTTATSCPSSTPTCVSHQVTEPLCSRPVSTHRVPPLTTTEATTTTTTTTTTRIQGTTALGLNTTTAESSVHSPLLGDRTRDSNPSPGVSEQTHSTTVVSEDSSTMGDNDRVAEKLRQFQSKVKRDDSEDTRGTYSNSVMSELDKQRRRNLIFDEERFEETFLKCLICREVYNEVDKLPKMLHCHHTFCLDCLLQMFRVEGEFRQSLTNVFRSMPMTVKIQCPTCREGIIISEPELRRLPNDHTIMELLFFVNQTGKNEVQYCAKHQMQPLNFFCEPCIMPVCCDCTVIDHKESKGHLVVNVDEAMKKYTPIVESTLGDIRTEKSTLAEKRLAIEHAQDDLDQVQRDLNHQIRSVFDSIRNILEEREQEIYDAAEGEIEKKRTILDGHLRVLSDREVQLNSQFNELQKAKDERDITQLFTGHKAAREVLASQVFVPTNSTKGFSVTFQFSSRSDNVIKQQIAGLGDILFQS